MSSSNTNPNTDNVNTVNTSTANTVNEARRRLLSVYKKLNAMVLGHDRMLKGIMLAVVAKEHVVVIGPPGTAKSHAVHLLSKLLDANFYKYLLTRFTDYSELFGPIDVKALAEGRVERRWTDIVNADIVFLDEIFKANSAILNSLLSMLQERIVYDSMTGTAKPTKLWSLVAASNETPEDDELKALYDRFAIKVFEDYINDDSLLLKAIEARWIDSNSVEPIASMNDVKTLHEHAVTLLSRKVRIDSVIEPIYKIYYTNTVSLVKALRSKGIIVSDRTIIEKLPKLYAAYLALWGVTIDSIMNAPLEILPFLASDKSQYKDINKVIEESLGEAAEIARALEEAKQNIRAGNLNAALSELDLIMNYDVTKLENRPWLKPRVEALLREARELKARIERAMEMLKEAGE